MDNRQINMNTQRRVLKFLEFVHSKENIDYQQGAQILENVVSKRLREEVKKEFYGKILVGFKFFKLNFSEKFLDSLTLAMQEIQLTPDEIIKNKGERDKKLYFVQKGKV